MRLVTLLVLALLAACGARASQGPAWPKMADPEEDGGESLAPRQPTVVSEASEDDDESEAESAKDEPAATEKPASEPAAAATATAPGGDAVTAPEESIEIEEIVIEIEDDDE